MKKVLLGLSIVALVVSCKDVPQGGNKGRVKLDDSVEHYSDDVQGADHGDHATVDHKVATDSVAAKTEVVVKDSIK